MISVVCVFNDRITLEHNLLNSLRGQDVEYELILVDNTHGAFKSAASALNRYAIKARGKFIMCVHQDVVLLSKSWLRDVEATLETIPDLGIAGCAGISEGGGHLGFILDRFYLFGKPLDIPQIVQSLDECLLMIPKDVFSRQSFDEQTFNGWHCYGADYCLNVQLFGLRAYVIPGPIHHNSTTRNLEGLLEQQLKLFRKHGVRYNEIWTLTGYLNRVWFKKALIKAIANRCAKPLLQVDKALFPYPVEIVPDDFLKEKTVLVLGHYFPLFSTNLDGLGKTNVARQADTSFIFWPLPLDMPLHFRETKFDGVLGVNILENIEQDGVLDLLAQVESLARKKIILLIHGYCGGSGKLISLLRGSRYSVHGIIAAQQAPFGWLLRRVGYYCPWFLDEFYAVKDVADRNQRKM